MSIKKKILFGNTGGRKVTDLATLSDGSFGGSAFVEAAVLEGWSTVDSGRRPAEYDRDRRTKKLLQRLKIESNKMIWNVKKLIYYLDIRSFGSFSSLYDSEQANFWNNRRENIKGLLIDSNTYISKSILNWTCFSSMALISCAEGWSLIAMSPSLL